MTRSPTALGPHHGPSGKGAATGTTRRAFVGAALASTVAATAVQPALAAQADQLVLGVIGVGGMGGNHLRNLAARRDATIAYVCDVDQTRLAQAARQVEQTSGNRPQAVSDMRKVLDDKRVDAVFIATPDHWHAPASILALDAGKHVYVEKPCCHNIREGRLMADAVARSGKVLQVGTQSRSTDCVAEGIQRIQNGEIGEVLVAKAWNSQRRGTIGKTQPSSPPATLDYDLWLGPAPEVPYRSNMLHGIWRWWYDFGCGDIGNDGVHDIDVALWGLGVKSHPATASCLGGKYFFDDDQQFPDTQYAVFEYPQPGAPQGRKKQLIFEQRIWSPYRQEDYENGAAFYGTKGVLIMGHTVGWRMYGPKNKLLAERTGRADLLAHHQDFFDCVRQKKQTPNAPIEVGHRAAAIVHLANISARLGRTLQFDSENERVIGDDQAQQLVSRKYRSHWATPKISS